MSLELHEGEQMTELGELFLEWLIIWAATTQLLQVYIQLRVTKEVGHRLSQSSLWLGARHLASSRGIESPVNYDTVGLFGMKKSTAGGSNK